MPISGLGRAGGTTSVACPRCHRPLRHETLRSGEQACPACNGVFEAVRFDPAKLRVQLPESVGGEIAGAAPCARHAGNRAENVCGRCGQFMCPLCSIDADGQVYCPPCFERLSAEGNLQSGVTRLWNWAGMSGSCLAANWLLWWMILPLLAWIPGIVFAVLGLKEKKSRAESDGVVRLVMLLILNALMGLGTLALGIAILLKGLGHDGAP